MGTSFYDFRSSYALYSENVRGGQMGSLERAPVRGRLAEFDVSDFTGSYGNLAPDD